MSVARRARRSKILVPGQTRAGGGLVLPGGQPPVRAPILHVPAGYEDSGPIVGKCLVPGCGAVFYAGQEDDWQRHVGACARSNMDRIEGLSIRKRMPVFDEDTWDPEWAEHQAKVGERMKREGRLVPHKHER